MKPLKAAIIGTGFMGPVHVEAVRRLGIAEVAAIVGQTDEQAEEAANRLGIPKFYSNYQEMLADDSIDVVHNCTPNHLHYEMNKAIIESGKHVFSEKPLAMTSEECLSLLELAQRHQVVHGVNFNYRAYSVIQHLKASVQEGDLGNVFLVHGSYLQDWLLYPTDYSWRLDERLGGKARAIGDIGSHWVDLVQHVTGQKVQRVMADLTTLYPVRQKPSSSVTTFQSAGSDVQYEDIQIGTEDFASILFEMDGGAKGMFLISQVSAGRKNQLTFEVNGTKSSAAWNQEQPAHLWLGHRDEPNQVLLANPALIHEEASDFIHYPGGHNEGWADAVRNNLQSFYHFILDGKDPGKDESSFATFRDGYQIATVVDAILESHQSKSFVQVRGRKGE